MEGRSCLLFQKKKGTGSRITKEKDLRNRLTKGHPWVKKNKKSAKSPSFDEEKGESMKERRRSARNRSLGNDHREGGRNDKFSKETAYIRGGVAKKKVNDVKKTSTS